MSALVIAALVVLWAVVLVPMFLRRHERTHEMAAAHRFAGAMRVLSRRRQPPTPAADRPSPVWRRLSRVAGPKTGALLAAASQRASERRAAVVARALSNAPARPERPAARGPVAARRRAARVAARRRGLAVLTSVVVLTAILAGLVGGWLIAVQALTDVLALAGLAQLRASTLADRAALRLPRSAGRPEARLTTAAVSPRAAPSPLRTSVASRRAAASEGFARAVGEDLTAPAPRARARTIVFDAVSETPIAVQSRPGRVAPKPVRRPTPGVPADFYEGPASPPRPEWVREPLLDDVDTDPDTMTDGLELLDGILGRASGQ